MYNGGKTIFYSYFVITGSLYGEMKALSEVCALHYNVPEE